MNLLILIIIIAVWAGLAFGLGQSKARALARKGGRLHSLPSQYGVWAALWCGLPSLVVLLVWQVGQPTIINRMVLADMPPVSHSQGHTVLAEAVLLNDVQALAEGGVVGQQVTPQLQAAANHYNHLQQISRAAMVVVVLLLSIGLGCLAVSKIAAPLRARNGVERVIWLALIISSLVAILTTVGIVLSVLFEAIRFFKVIPVTDFLFGLKWSPQMAIRPDQVGSSGAFGAIPVFWGTLMISGIAMLVAVPFGLFSAIYLAEYAPKKMRAIAKPLLEILAGVPTVVYGFFAALTVAPMLREIGVVVGVDVSSESALAAGLVMGIMIIPFISSLSDDVINAVPQTMRDGALALGSTRSETVLRVIIPAALPGIVGSILLAMSRAIGETMIVVMAAGLSANFTANPLETVTTVTVQIVTLLVGDQEFDSPKTLAAFALGLLLFVVTLVLNIIALQVVRRYRQQYE